MIAAAPVLLAALLLPAQAEPDEAVSAGREALGGWWDQYPWYDRAQDAVRPVDVSEPWYMRWKWEWNWSGWRGRSWWGGGSWLPTSFWEWVAWIVIGLLLIALVYIMVRVIRARRADATLAAALGAEEDPAEAERRIESLPWPARREPGDFLAKSLRCYEQGDYREAIIYLFSHELVELDKRQLLRLERGKTNRQYARELGARTALRRMLEQTIVVFEDAFFGNYTIERRRFEACWSRLNEFESLLAEEAA